MQVVHRVCRLRQGHIRTALDSMRWFENVDATVDLARMFESGWRPDYVGSHPDARPLDVRDRSWMIELKTIQADPQNKLIDFEDRGVMSRREYFNLVIGRLFAKRILGADEQLRAGRRVLNSQAKGALILINDEFQGLRREKGAQIVAEILHNPRFGIDSLDLVVYIHELCDSDSPNRQQVQLFTIWRSTPSAMDRAYQNFLVDFTLGGLVHFGHGGNGRPRVRWTRDGRVMDADQEMIEALTSKFPA